MPKIRLLGLDLGTKTGFAYLTVDKGNGTALVSGAWNFKPTRFDSPALRFSRFGTAVRSFLALGVDRVFFEKVLRHKGTYAAHIYGGFYSELIQACDEYGVLYEGIGVQEIKKHIAGKGNAPKALVMAALKQRGYHPETEDEGDALGAVLVGWEKTSF